MDNQDPAAPALNADAGPAPPGHAQPFREVKLPAYWPSKPAAWFTLAESRFRLKNIVDEQSRYEYLLSALPESTIIDVLDVLEDAPEDLPYTHLKTRPLQCHVLSPYEQLDVLFKTDPLGVVRSLFSCSHLC